MKKSKKYEVWTVQDMIDCTNKNNLDNFLKDLKNVIESAHALNKLSSLLKAGNVESEGFTWLDDNKNDLELKIKTK